MLSSLSHVPIGMQASPRVNHYCSYKEWNPGLVLRSEIAALFEVALPDSNPHQTIFPYLCTQTASHPAIYTTMTVCPLGSAPSWTLTRSLSSVKCAFVLPLQPHWPKPLLLGPLTSQLWQEHFPTRCLNMNKQLPTGLCSGISPSRFCSGIVSPIKLFCSYPPFQVSTHFTPQPPTLFSFPALH